ncbi:MAG: DUF1294 domain-containing protein [Clostridia bacterium]|nr:DUF1294 domain-containing protein [Clostridia bacterium]
MPYIIYLLSINLISVIFCVFDKHQAKTGGWRIKERTLFALCFLGGGVGMYLTMKVIRHKTLHKRFMLGIPLIIILQLIIFLYFKHIF